MVQAAFRLAQCFRYGLGVNRQPEMAFKWTQRAASKGHAESQHQLGEASPHPTSSVMTERAGDDALSR